MDVQVINVIISIFSIIAAIVIGVIQIWQNVNSKKTTTLAKNKKKARLSYNPQNVENTEDFIKEPRQLAIPISVQEAEIHDRH